MKNKSKIILALMLAGSLAACGKKEEAKPEEVKQEAISKEDLPEGAKITNDTTTPIEEMCIRDRFYRRGR